MKLFIRHIASLLIPCICPQKKSVQKAKFYCQHLSDSFSSEFGWFSSLGFLRPAKVWKSGKVVSLKKQPVAFRYSKMLPSFVGGKASMGGTVKGSSLPLSVDIVFQAQQKHSF